MDTKPQTRQFSFKRHQRLKSRKTIDDLFLQNRSIKIFPVRLVYLSNTNCQFNTQVAFVASKKNFKRAVDRNRIKRLMREAYRLNKKILEEKLSGFAINLSVMFIYQANEELPFQIIESRLRQLLTLLSEKIIKDQQDFFL